MAGSAPRRRAFALLLAFAGLAFAPATAAFAQDVTVKRNVTVREAPRRSSGAVTYPVAGDRLTILDNGAKSHGYYHVRLADGRTGWVYYTYVTKPAQLATAAASQPGDVAVAHFIDMDQGNATLLEFPCGAVLIDAGGRDTAAGDHLLAYLHAFFARRTDLNNRIAAIFVTHTHIDHNRALMRVAEAFAVGGYIDNGVPNGSGRNPAKAMKDYVAAHSIPTIAGGVDSKMIDEAGTSGLSGPVIDPVACPRVDPDIRVLSGRYDDKLPGWSDEDLDNGNNQSLVIRVAYGKAKFLFTGDMEEPAIESLVTRYQNSDLLDVDLWEVGHHGSQNGVTPSLLAAMSPEMAVISMGNSTTHALWSAYAYGHPRRAAVTLIAQAVRRERSPTDVPVADGAKRFSTFTLTKAVYGTGWNGDIDVKALPDGTLTVTSSR